MKNVTNEGYLDDVDFVVIGVDSCSVNLTRIVS